MQTVLILSIYIMISIVWFTIGNKLDKIIELLEQLNKDKG